MWLMLDVYATGSWHKNRKATKLICTEEEKSYPSPLKALQIGGVRFKGLNWLSFSY